MSFSATNRLSSVALKMASVAAKGNMGLVQTGEGRTALATSKLTAIAYRLESLDKGTLMGMYNGLTTDTTLALF